MALNNPYALSFDGTDDRIQFAKRVLPTGAISISFVFAHDASIGKDNEEIFCTCYSRPNSYGIRGWISSGRNLTIAGAGALSDWNFMVVRYAVDDLLTGDPHTVCFTWTGTTVVDGVKLYIDDMFSPVATATASRANSTTHSYNLRIGDQSQVEGRNYRGYLDNFTVWGKVLDQAGRERVRDRYLTGEEDDLILLLRMDVGTGTVAHDSSPNANHGTIYGATWVPGLVDLHLPGEVPISAILHGSSNAIAKADRIRSISATLVGAATSTGGTPIRIRGLSANLQGAGTTNVRMNLIAALKAHLQGQATLKSNMLVLFIPEGVYVIDADEIFAKDQPSRGQVVANYIEVWVNPLNPTEEPEEVYRSKDPVAIPPGATKTITIHFDDEPVTEPVATLEEAGAGLSIVDTKYYAWGADVKIKNAGSGAQTCIIVATGKPLKVQGREKIVKEDPVSIQENGLKKYTFDNPFVQDRATAEMIADKLLSFANARRDIVIEWRGDPALELADVTMIPEYQRRDIDQRGIFYVTKQELEFDGGLRAKLEGRKM